MTTHQHHPGPGDQPTESADSADRVLDALRERHHTATRVEVEQLQLAVQWAILHPVESLDQAATIPGTEGELAIAGPGAPLVAEFCVAELALVLDMSTDAGQAYLGDAVELSYRLPRLWARVASGQVPVWKARKIAQATRTLPEQGADYVDTHLAPVAHRCSFAQLERTIDDALTRYDPAQAERRRAQAAERRHFDVHLDHATGEGTVRIDGELDLADALDLDHALATGARDLADLGCPESLDVRRSMAAGALARHQPTLDLPTEPVPAPAPEPSRPRELMIYVHLADQARAGVENTRTTISVRQVQDWCTRSNTRVTIRPVIDLNTNLHTDSYRPTPLMREQAALINPTCVFPRCTRPSRTLDDDHVEEWSERPGEGGLTESRNLAPLCRRHHRYKTHGGWQVTRTGPRTFTWTSPHGQIYVWDTTHTRHTA